MSSQESQVTTAAVIGLAVRGHEAVNDWACIAWSERPSYSSLTLGSWGQQLQFSMLERGGDRVILVDCSCLVLQAAGGTGQVVYTPGSLLPKAVALQQHSLRAQSSRSNCPMQRELAPRFKPSLG